MTIDPRYALKDLTFFSINVEIGIFVVEWGNTFPFSFLWLIWKALVSIKELEKNQENSSSTVMVAFYLRVVSIIHFPFPHTICLFILFFAAELSRILQRLILLYKPLRFSDRISIIDCIFGNTWRVFGVLENSHKSIPGLDARIKSSIGIFWFQGFKGKQSLIKGIIPPLGILQMTLKFINFLFLLLLLSMISVGFVLGQISLCVYVFKFWA